MVTPDAGDPANEAGKPLEQTPPDSQPDALESESLGERKIDLPESYTNALSDLAERFKEIEKVLEGHEQVEWSKDQGVVLTEAQQAFFDQTPPVLDIMEDAWRKFQAEGDKAPLEPEQRKEWIQEARRILKPYVEQSKIVSVATNKPEDHQGNTHVIAAIVEPNFGKPVETIEKSGKLKVVEKDPTMLGVLLDHYFKTAPVIQAHRNRLGIIARWVPAVLAEHLPLTPEDQGIPILSLASGPAIEYQLLAKQGGDFPGMDKMFLRLRDISADSLEAGQKSAAILNNVKQIFVSARQADALEWAKPFLDEHQPEEMPELDDTGNRGSYVAGLFEYIGMGDPLDREAKAIMSALYHRAEPGSMLLATIVVRHPDSVAQEFLLDWEIKEGDEARGRALGEHLGCSYRADITDTAELLDDISQLKPGEFCITYDPTGANMFLWVRTHKDETKQSEEASHDDEG